MVKVFEFAHIIPQSAQPELREIKRAGEINQPALQYKKS